MRNLKLVLGSLERHRKTKLNCPRVQGGLYLEFQLNAWATVVKFTAATSPRLTISIQDFHSVLQQGLSRPVALENEVGLIWRIFVFLCPAAWPGGMSPWRPVLPLAWPAFASDSPGCPVRPTQNILHWGSGVTYLVYVAKSYNLG